MGTRTRVITAGLLTVGTAALLPAGAGLADPKGDVFTLTCGGQTYTVTSPPGMGEFTPAMDLDSQRVFIPVSFGDFTGTVTGADGFTATFTEEGTVVKGSGKQRGTTACTFRFEATETLDAAQAAEEDLPGPGTYTFVGTGSVVGQVRGH